MKVKYKDQVIEVCEGATFEVVGGDLVINPKEQEFKDGDFIYWEHKEDKQNNGIAIFKSKDDKWINLYIDLLSLSGLIADFTYVTKNKIIVRLATEEEKQKLFDTLEKDGKKWNPETKQIEDILKVGDLCIFWDDDKEDSVIATYTELKYPHYTPDGFNYASTIKDEESHVCWKNAIKCTSLEQYINFKK